MGNDIFGLEGEPDLPDLFGNPIGVAGEGEETDEPDDEEDEFKEDVHVENDVVTEADL